METMTLWLVDVRELANRETLCMSLLPPERRKTAEGYRRQVDRLHQAAAGLLLRQVLKVTQDEDISLNGHGKPALTAGKIKFNLSHNGNYAVLAVFHSELGVDIEPVIDRRPIIPKRYLQEDELAWLGNDPTPERFTTLWTRLESALKADGRGFDMENRKFSVVDSGSPWHLHTFAHDGHIISCAAGVPFEVSVTKLSAEDLLG